MAPVLALSAQAQPPDAVAPDCGGPRAILLVGGFGDDWHYFEPWLDELKQSGVCVFGSKPDFRKVTLPEGAQLLRDNLWLLQDQGFKEVTILAHSMGGLAARKAVSMLNEREGSEDLSVLLHAYGTPWGGFFWANFVRWTPGGEAISSLLGYPMSADIGSEADFMKSLREPLPANVKLVVHHSKTDTVSEPETAQGQENFAAILTQASEFREYRDLGHVDYVEYLTAAQ